MSFGKKVADIMHTLQSDYGDFILAGEKNESKVERAKPCKHSCSAV
jgi:hypothetical protein